MSEQLLGQKLGQVDIKQTRPIRFKDEAINKLKNKNIDFGKRSYVFIPFIVSKDSHLKGLKLRVYKGALGEKETVRVFYLLFWFNNKSCRYSLGHYSQTFGVKECDEAVRQIYLSHTDPKTGFWIKDPVKTFKDEVRIVPKSDPTGDKDYTVNEVIEAYCGCSIDGQEDERGFSKDKKDGCRASKMAREYSVS